MKTITALIVDDERSGRDNLTRLLSAFCKNVKVVAQAKSVDEALEHYQIHQPDVVFLDIEMPNKNGFDFIAAFQQKAPPLVVFVTAFDHFALKAFEVSAIDYLLKPIDIDRLVQAIAKVADKLALNKKDDLKLLLENKDELSTIVIPHKNAHITIPIKEIISVEADRMYSHLTLSSGEQFVVAKKLSYYEDLFADLNFMKRVHRSWLVNLQKVTSVQKSQQELHLQTGKVVSYSKSKKEKVLSYFGG